MLKIVNEFNFASEVLESHVPVLVDVYASWCPACNELMPTIERLAEETGGFGKVTKLDSDKSKQLTRQLRVRNLPTCIAFKNGQEIGRLVGVQELNDLHNLFMSKVGTTSEVPEDVHRGHFYVVY